MEFEVCVIGARCAPNTVFASLRQRLAHRRFESGIEAQHARCSLSFPFGSLPQPLFQPVHALMTSERIRLAHDKRNKITKVPSENMNSMAEIIIAFIWRPQLIASIDRIHGMICTQMRRDGNALFRRRYVELFACRFPLNVPTAIVANKLNAFDCFCRDSAAGICGLCTEMRSTSMIFKLCRRFENVKVH